MGSPPFLERINFAAQRQNMMAQQQPIGAVAALLAQRERELVGLVERSRKFGQPPGTFYGAVHEKGRTVHHPASLPAPWFYKA